jgi:colanic acid biosynthesis glycosyl transferase WcaI
VNTKKQILIVCQHFWPESFRINDIADYFIEQDCKVDVLCGIPNYPKGKFFKGYSYFSNRKQKYNSINIHRAFEIPRGNNTNLRIFINYISFPIASLLYVPRMLFRKYDKIFIYQLSPVMMSISGIVIGKLKRVETTMYVLDLWPENLFSVLPTNNRYLRTMATKVSHWHYKKVDKLVVLSEKMKKHLLETVDISENKIIVLPQTSEKIYETEITDEKLASRFNKGFNVLFTGSITPAQSFETIIEAAKKIKAERQIKINWIIVGDGMSRKWLEVEVKKAGLDDNFYFEGFKPMTDIPKYTAIADVLIGCLVKSDLLEATIPAKVMSYIASGKPMVLSMDGEVQDLINNTIKCGFVGPTNNADAFAENIKKLYQLPQKERENMGRLAREYHFKHFERNLILNKLYNFIFS